MQVSFIFWSLLQIFHSQTCAHCVRFFHRITHGVFQHCSIKWLHCGTLHGTNICSHHFGMTWWMVIDCHLLKNQNGCIVLNFISWIVELYDPCPWSSVIQLIEYQAFGIQLAFNNLWTVNFVGLDSWWANAILNTFGSD